MAVIGKLAVEVTAKVGELVGGLKSAEKSIDSFDDKAQELSSTMDVVNNATQALKSQLMALAGVFSAGAFLGKLIETQRQFDILSSSLITVSGSAEAAEREFAWIKEFAATTPFALNEVAGAFVRMKSLGLDPSRAALESYGNTASAMGTSLDQMIEAVADAATGEFERLKEFGIRSSKEGDRVSFTFQGITTTVRNSAEEITKYLNDIGNNQFAGAMAERAKTLDGAISNLGDSWDELFRTINSGNVGGIIYDSVKLATGAIERAILVVDALNSSFKESERSSQGLKTILDGLSIVMETAAVIGVNVAFVLTSIGRELGGLAAQASAVAKLDFRGAKTIGRLMMEDAVAARAEVDRLTAAILSSRAAATANMAQLPTQSEPGVTAPRATTTIPALSVPAKTRESAITDPLQAAMEAWVERDAKMRDQLEERERQYWADRVQRIQDGLLSESELLEQKYQRDLERLDAAVMTEEERRAAREALEMEHLTRMGEIEAEGHALRIKAEADAAAEIERIRKANMTNLEKFTAMSYQEQAKAVATAMTQQLTSVNTTSRAMFNIQKAANISQAIMDTYAGATRALKDYPAPWSYAVAGATMAAGLARVASIRSQSFGGGAVGSASVGGGGVAASAGMAAQAPAMNQTITIQGVGAGDLFSGDAVRTLIDRLIDAQRNGARIVLA